MSTGWRSWFHLPPSLERSKLLDEISKRHKRTLRIEGEVRDIVDRLVTVNEQLGYSRAETMEWLTKDATVIESAPSSPVADGSHKEKT